ncbi:MAG: LapA family protein [Gammaproteobacteria bacterium]|nr:LapA family protein [Gammaproteobacteria bacterium]MBT3488902.1 LapA family protein [Gammaproteobacteria bacterium]MBT3718565.1 LapA family protein [Gammaproteobacteria bacterium]MBT3844466.1 LapA family protein [Gammaproteobacteria bacterium]MBT3891920.1 LapA family protein [Gammaproteobacteria bacterium]
MFKSVLVLIFILLLLIFSSQNMEHAAIHVVTGRPLQVPLILIIAGAFVAGYATALFTFIMKESKRRNKNRDIVVRGPDRF